MKRLPNDAPTSSDAAMVVPRVAFEARNEPGGR
jgi:hypothetical protein